MKKTSNIEKIIQVISTLAIEELYFDKESRTTLLELASERKTTKELIIELNNKYRQK